MRYTLNGYIPSEFDTRFPFRRDNRRPDGTWEAQDATEDNIKGTSVDRHDPVWPRWRKTPPLDGEGEFVADEPFFDIDEITQTAKFYPPGAPLVDRNANGNPATRQRVRDFLTGSHWRRRLLVGPSPRGNGTTGAAETPYSSANVDAGAGGYYEAPSEVGPRETVDDGETLYLAIGRKVFQLVGGTREERSAVEGSVRRVVSSPWTQTDPEGRRALANLMNKPGVQTLDLSGREENWTPRPNNVNHANPRRFPVYRTLSAGELRRLIGWLPMN